MKLFAIVTISLFAIAAPAAAQEPPKPAPAPAAAANPGEPVDLMIYSGSYTLALPNVTLEVRVFMNEEASLVAELIGPNRTQSTVLRPTETAHKFLHEARDDIWLLFTVENGKATQVTMHQAGREVTGPKKP